MLPTIIKWFKKRKFKVVKCPDCNSTQYELRHYSYKTYGVCEKCNKKFRIS